MKQYMLITGQVALLSSSCIKNKIEEPMSSKVQRQGFTSHSTAWVSFGQGLNITSCGI